MTKKLSRDIFARIDPSKIDDDDYIICINYDNVNIIALNSFIYNFYYGADDIKYLQDENFASLIDIMIKFKCDINANIHLNCYVSSFDKVDICSESFFASVVKLNYSESMQKCKANIFVASSAKIYYFACKNIFLPNIQKLFICKSENTDFANGKLYICGKEINNMPNLQVMQIGLNTVYIFNGENVSLGKFAYNEKYEYENYTKYICNNECLDYDISQILIGK
jgi:hypothetical protein